MHIEDFATSPQWWTLRVEPEVVGDRDAVSLMLRLEEGERGVEPSDVRLGGALSHGDSKSWFGPVLRLAGSGPATSLNRWYIADDWRFWRTQPLGSRRTTSSLRPTTGGGSSSSFEEARDRVLAGAMARNEAHFNIRLLVEFRDGRRIVF